MKQVIALLLILALALTLCACGTSSGKELLDAAKGDQANALKSYYGSWKYEDEDRYIFLYPDNTWDYRDEDMFILMEGEFSPEDGKVMLIQEDNTLAFALELDSSDCLIDDEGNVLARYDLSDEGEEEGDMRPFLGMWKYDELPLTIGINADGTWALYDLEGGAESRGTCYMEGRDLVLANRDGGWMGSLSLGSDDRLYDNDGDALSPYVEPDTSHEEVKEDRTPWFVDNDLLVNYSYGEPAKNVVGGAAVRGSDTHSYTRIPATWYVEQTSYQSTGDGNCIVTLTATALTDGSTMPNFVNREGYTVTWTWSLCDYYSGLILTEAEDDTFYSYNYEANGEPIHVEFRYSHDITKYKDLSYLLELTLTVRMPEDYDGLVLVCYDAPESYEVKLARDLIYEGRITLPVDQLPGWREMGSGLICRINN